MTETYELTTRGRFKRLLDAGDEAAKQLAAEALEQLASDGIITRTLAGNAYCGACDTLGLHPELILHAGSCLHTRARALLADDRTAALAGYAAEGS